MEREMAVLLACAAPGGVLPPLAGLSWPRLGELAGRHRMTLLLARRLLGEPGVSEADAAWLTGEARAGSARALAMTAELAGMMAALEAAGVAGAAYKGPTLAVRAYGDASLRWCSDLDLLVPAAAVPAALEVLRGMGYRPLFRHTPAQAAAFRRSDGDYPLRHERTGTLVELHSHVSPPRFACRLPTERLLARRAPVAVGPFAIPALADDDLLLALAVHGAKHRWARLEWLAAFAALLPRGDEGALDAAARAAGAHTALAVARELCRTLLGVPLPPAEARGAALAAEAAARLLGEEPRHTRGDTAGNLRFNLRLCDSAADRARTAWRWLTLPTPEDWAWRPLPDALFPAYRVLRPLRLLGRYAPGRTGRWGVADRTDRW